MEGGGQIDANPIAVLFGAVGIAYGFVQVVFKAIDHGRKSIPDHSRDEAVEDARRRAALSVLGDYHTDAERVAAEYRELAAEIRSGFDRLATEQDRRLAEQLAMHRQNLEQRDREFDRLVALFQQHDRNP